jgi:hypothetical protein
MLHLSVLHALFLGRFSKPSSMQPEACATAVNFGFVLHMVRDTVQTHFRHIPINTCSRLS